MIPQWNQQGGLPPIDDNRPADPERSPYPVDVVQIVSRFATSIERCAVLDGFFRHRSELHRLGLTQGFQWLDGSFMENIEMLEGRAPNDMDVVSFVYLNDDAVDQLEADDLKLLVDNEWIKDTFKVDFYVVSLFDHPESLVQVSAYWYSMWSHRRSKQWKGFLKVGLAPDQDQAALAMLDAKRQEIIHEQN
ncbi:DUF6932 family protein [Pseudomonas mandelii]